jgi:hypothetical protein
MANFLINVNFYGHGDPALSGLPVREMPPSMKYAVKLPLLALRREVSLEVVGNEMYDPKYNNQETSQLWINNYNAVLGPSNKSKSGSILEGIMSVANTQRPDMDKMFLVTGYSAGGMTALYFSQHVNKRKDAELLYIGLSDAAFYEEDAHLMTSPGVNARYMKNYYQTKGNADDVAERHDYVAGFHTNFNLDSQISATEIDEMHKDAVIRGNRYMSNDLRWCVEHFSTPH